MAKIIKPQHVFTFTWSIHNFSYCAVKKREFISSPEFEVEFLKGNKLFLKLYPRGDRNAGFIALYLCKIKKDKVNFFFYLDCKCNEIFQDEYDALEFKESSTGWGHSDFLLIGLLKEKNKYLKNDTLTLRCQIWSEVLFPVSLTHYVHTIINVKKIDYVWKIINVVESNYAFNETFEFPRLSSKSPISKIDICNGDDDDGIHFAIHSLMNHDTFFLVYAIHLLDANGKKAQSVTGQRLFEKFPAKQILEFSCLSKNQLLSNKQLYFPNGTLTLRCEFSISTNDFEVGFKKIGTLPALDASNELNELDETLWEESMKRLCIEEEFSDVTVRAANKRFPVHKDVLSIHSEVFTAMLKHDMKEQKSGVIDIEDLEDDTVDKMLTYLYTGTVEGMDCSVAQKLFFAADKYEIKSLLKKCSNYLKFHLDESNACDVLVLADTHQDQELKKRAMDFVVEHASKIIKTEKWLKMIETHAHLTSVTLQLFVCQKYNEK